MPYSGRFTVRCCCKPNKILGTLPAPAFGDTFRFSYVKQSGSMYDPIGPADGGRPVATERVLIVMPLQRVVLEPGMPAEWAYKAHGVTLEQLRHVPGFEEHESTSQLTEPRQ